MRLSDKQAEYTEWVGLLIAWTATQRDADGHRLYRLRFGDAYRDSRVTYGHVKSTHRFRLGIDLILDKWDGKKWVYQTSTKAYEPLGVFWESLGGTWGGRFKDGNHFSRKHNGVG